MSSVPEEFNPDHIAANAAADSHMYREQVHSQEPMKSMLENNPEITNQIKRRCIKRQSSVQS